jgi:hypothetical protein
VSNAGRQAKWRARWPEKANARRADRKARRVLLQRDLVDLPAVPTFDDSALELVETVIANAPAHVKFELEADVQGQLRRQESGKLEDLGD